MWCIVVAYRQCTNNVYTACFAMYNYMHMHNIENLSFIQIHALAVWVEHLALSLSLYLGNLSRVCSVVCATHQASLVLFIIDKLTYVFSLEDYKAK